MIDSFDITKKYKLVDVEGYLNKLTRFNATHLYYKYFNNNILNNDLVVAKHTVYGRMVILSKDGDMVICNSELKYLEEIKEEEPMKEINYTEDWYMDCPKTEEEWNVFVQIMELFGVKLYSKDFITSYNYIKCVDAKVRRYSMTELPDTVTLLEAITLLQRPVKTEQQIQIEKLEQTIAQAQEQIKNLKATVKQ